MRLTSSGNLSAAEFTEITNVSVSATSVPNLITNGLGELESNYNFPGSVFYTNDYVVAPGCFHVSGVVPIYCTEKVEINKDDHYKLEGSFKSIGAGGDSKIYFGIIPYDSDGLQISHNYIHYYEGSKTILTSDLNNGDTLVHVRDTTSWLTSASAYWFRYVGVWGSMSDYPDYTYTRVSEFYDHIPSAGAITLTAQWNRGTIPSGTAVANMYSGGTYQYIGAGNELTPAIWTEYINNRGSTDYITSWNCYGDASEYDYFRYGTKYIVIMILTNHGQDGTYELLMDKFLWYNISRSQSLPVTFTINSNDKVSCNEFYEGYTTGGATLRMREELYADIEDVDKYRIKIKGELREI